jgi:hypothetical protein
MLAITIAVLGGIGLISIGALRSANGVMQAGSENAASEAGVLLTVVGTQSNSSGTFVWLYNYGWNPAGLTSVYVDGGLVQVSSSTCSSVQPNEMCVVKLPVATHGTVSLTFGDRILSIPV